MVDGSIKSVIEQTRVKVRLGHRPAGATRHRNSPYLQGHLLYSR